MDRTLKRALHLSVSALMLLRYVQSNPIPISTSTEVSTVVRDAIHDAVSVAKCRLRCLEEFLMKDDFTTVDDEECDKHKECSVCWKICDYLQQDFPTWGEMCIFPHEICYDGCIQACLYHLDQDLKIHYSATAVIDGYAFPSEPRVTGNRVTWQKVEEERKSPLRNSNSRKKVIYSVLVAPEGSQWILVGQTLHTKIRLEADKRRSGTSRLMVIAVMKEGVIGVTRSTFVVSPSDALMVVPTAASPSSNVRPNGLPWNIPMASEIGTVMDGPPPGYVDTRSNAAPGSQAMFMFETQSPLGLPEIVTSAYSQAWEWDLHAKSVTRNPVFRTVDAVVAWNPRPSSQGEYMVTWEVNKENFGVKGHVYTRNSSVTLNLNPEEVYRVQVEYISRAKQESEASPVILIDTHNVTSPTYWPQDTSNQVERFFFRSKFEMVIMSLVAFCAVLLTFVAFFIWRMKRKQIMKKIRAERFEVRDAQLENGVLEYDKSKTSLLLTDHRRHRPPVTPMTVSTATSPFEFDSNMFPKIFRFPSVTKTNTATSDSSVTEVLLETSPKRSPRHKVENLLFVPPFVHQSMPNIAPEALETHVTRFKNLQMPSSRASVAIGGSTELPFVQNGSVLTLKVPPLGKRGKLANGTLENNNIMAATSLQSINELPARS